MPVDNAAQVEVPTPRPCFIAATGRPLFVWHHAPPSHLRRGAGVVLCQPLGYEYMSAYRSWRILATRLAALGFDVLRVDYDGTGDSEGDYDDPDRVGAWLRSIDCAIDEARMLSGSNVVALIGLRAGAMLALQAAAARGGVDRLVLWSPFLSGRAYLREVKAFAALTRDDHACDDADERSAINASGHLLTAETAAALGGWNIDAVTTRPAPDVLVVDRDDCTVDAKLESRLIALGSRLTRVRPAGTAAMLTLPHNSRVPDQALDAITAWFRDWRVPPASPGALASRAEHAAAVPSECRARTVRFGPGDRLFGVLDLPADDTGRAPAIILFNTGTEYHIGPHRLYVRLAREWAARGHLVLRFDLGGIGDSEPPPDAEGNVAYPGQMLDDACEAIAFVRKEWPRRRVIVAGLCSGGWLAFLAAREGLEVDGIVSINPPLFLRDGAAGAQWVLDGDDLERYQQSIRNPAKWIKALRGAASYANFTRVAASTLGRQFAVRVNGVLGDAIPNGLAKDLITIADRKIRSLFIFSRGDDGLEYFQLHAQPALRRAGVRDFVQHVVVEGAGHTFRPRAAQAALRKLLIDFVASQDCRAD